LLCDAHGYFVEPIIGEPNPTVTYGPTLGDVIYGGKNTNDFD
jgi:hypothetical protein